MPRVDELEQQLLELGARTRFTQLTDERDDLIERFPFLAGIASAPRFANIIEQARKFRTEAPREYRKYDKTLKEDALSRLRDGGYLSDVARAVDVPISVLSAWAKKAGVRVVAMSREEMAKRAQAGRNGQSIPLALPPPSTATKKMKALPPQKVNPPSKKKKKGKKGGSSGRNTTMIANEKGREVLRAMPDDGSPIHLGEISKRTNIAKGNINWRLMKREEAGHAKKTTALATWVKTPEGRQWQNQDS